MLRGVFIFTKFAYILLIMIWKRNYLGDKLSARIQNPFSAIKIFIIKFSTEECDCSEAFKA